MTTLSLSLLWLWLAAAAGQQPAENRVIASTGDWSITSQQFELIIQTLPDQARTFYSRPENQRRFLDEIVEMWVMSAEARRTGVDKAAGTKAILDFYTNNILSNEYTKQLTQTNAVADAAIEAYYKANAADYTETRFSHILILNAESPAVRGQNIPNALPAAEAQKKIEEIRTKLTAANFEELAKEFSQDPGSAANGGDLGFIAKGQLVPEVEKAAFELTPGILSAVIESPFGFHILKGGEKRITPLNDVRDAIRQKVNGEQVTEQIQSRIKAAGVKIDESFFNR